VVGIFVSPGVVPGLSILVVYGSPFIVIGLGWDLWGERVSFVVVGLIFNFVPCVGIFCGEVFVFGFFIP
jgi:hypothetical protein